MDINSLLKENEGDFLTLFKDRLNLNSLEIDKSMEGVKEGVSEAIVEESTNSGVGMLLNLFSDNKNSDDSNSFVTTLSKKVVSSLLKKGLGTSKAKAISAKAVPFIVNLISSKVGGDKGVLGNLLGENTSKVDLAKGLLNKFLK